MYRIFCPKCKHYNYSASRVGKWICCHCGEDLNTKPLEQNKEKKLEILA